ncbi:tyrosine-type recombinase/integrase [Massilia sp. LC238]|uniref:tyrosine-type recombinase/integrase n=1 Tax=Massilia sp. LC238 TaxID=1502852 RepID=UPI0004E43A4D|nr:tyrosine-type recombinase/integrase [Massilia sp. LC238]KFC68257.1 Phage integrase [Massilia sp. LC238]
MPSQDVLVSFDLPVAPLESFALPAHIDGSNGSNRASAGTRQIRADNDIDAIKAWLARFLDKQTTFDNYRKEAERLLLWSTLELGKPLSSLTHEDWLVYQRFLRDPKPARRWLAAEGRKYPRTHPEWRPFAGPLSASSQRQAAVILNALFSWLVTAGYLAGNPLALSRERRHRPAPRVTRYLDDEMWREVKMTVDALPRETPREREHYLRLRWLVSLCYVCGLRISEITGNGMGGFFRRRDREGDERWWLEVLGKGDKLRIVPATDELMVELARYRRELKHPPYPVPGEATPLLLPIGGKLRPMTRGAIHEIFKDIFAKTADRLRQRGPEYEAGASHMEQASAHWMRHTAGSHMANNDVDLRHVRDNLGHESISTTNTYLHSSDDARHAETEAKHKIGW